MLPTPPKASTAHLRLLKSLEKCNTFPNLGEQKVHPRREKMNKLPHPELVIGLVAPIGVNMDMIAQKLSYELRAVKYTPHTIHLTQCTSEILKEYEGEDADLTAYERKIYAANKLREARGKVIMAALAVQEIRKIRATVLSSGQEAFDDSAQAESNCYIIRQLKRPEEIEFLRSIYGRKFIQVSATLDSDDRLRHLMARLSQMEPQLRETETRARTLISMDEDEDASNHSSPGQHHFLNEYGQKVRDAFHSADVFIDASTEESIARTTSRFIRAFFGKNSISPSIDEYGSYLAKTASLRTVDLSRQVGAAILSKCGDVISLGCNEVPKAGGGNYWDDDTFKARDIDQDSEANKAEIRRIVHDFLFKLETNGILQDGQTASTVAAQHSSMIGETLLSDITEFGRMTHAEMSAICDAARLGRALKDTTLYVTTFPCHNCAKHIVASGIKRVVFVEPYSKSRAERLHSDSIVVGNDSQGKVQFSHFKGISPRRYRDIFEKGKRRDSAGTIFEWDSGEPRARVDDITPTHISKELYALRTILSAQAD